jgi:hypothetical protein
MPYLQTIWQKLKQVRAEVFGDDYMTDEIFFTALEANVCNLRRYADRTDTEYASDGKTVVKEATTGVYQVMFGVVQTAEVIGEGGELVETESWFTSFPQPQRCCGNRP